MRTSSDNYLDIMRNECKLEACHDSVLKSEEYKRVMEELQKMSDELRHTKSLERYVSPLCYLFFYKLDQLFVTLFCPLRNVSIQPSAVQNNLTTIFKGL